MKHVSVDQSDAGRIVGRSFPSLSFLETNTCCTITKGRGKGGCTTFSISGRDNEIQEEARDWIVHISKYTEPLIEYAPNISVRPIEIPAEKVGQLIGADGSTIDSIRCEYNAQIRIIGSDQHGMKTVEVHADNSCMKECVKRIMTAIDLVRGGATEVAASSDESPTQGFEHRFTRAEDSFSKILLSRPSPITRKPIVREPVRESGAQIQVADYFKDFNNLPKTKTKKKK